MHVTESRTLEILEPDSVRFVAAFYRHHDGSQHILLQGGLERSVFVDYRKSATRKTSKSQTPGITFVVSVHVRLALNVSQQLDCCILKVHSLALDLRADAPRRTQTAPDAPRRFFPDTPKRSPDAPRRPQTFPDARRRSQTP